MAKQRMVVEFGMGSSLRRRDYTAAARRAIENAFWHNSLGVAEVLGFSRDAMLIDVEIGVQRPGAVDVAALQGLFPYGTPHFRIVKGGLDVPAPDGSGGCVMANCALVVSFDMEPAQ